MPDISKCNNVTCSLRTKCYRFTSEDSLWQSYTNFEQNDDSTCDYFYDRSEITTLPPENNTDLEIYKSIKQSTIFGGKPYKPYRKRGQFLTF